jgi:hypothetical protein
MKIIIKGRLGEKTSIIHTAGPHTNIAQVHTTQVKPSHYLSRKVL